MAISSTSAKTGESAALSPSVNPLSRQEIFEILALRTCKVVWKPVQNTTSASETSGCFVFGASLKIQVLTCFHEAKWNQGTIEIIYKSNHYKGTLAQGISPDLAFQHDMVLLDVESLDPNTLYFDISESPSYPLAGDKVYFAGFPFNEADVLVHKGSVSSSASIERDGAFKLDGTIVRGHSGGPVARVHKNAIELIGIINSQLVDLTEKLIEISPLSPPQIYPHNQPPTRYARNLDVNTVVKQLVDNVLSNLSTGIGKASFVSLHLFIVQPPRLPLPTLRSPFSSSTTEKSGSHNNNYGVYDDYGATEAWNGMQKPDVWMKRKGLVKETEPFTSTTQSTAIAKRSELPVNKWERIPAQASRNRTAFDWTHYMKTSKRELFNAITKRENNKGKENSRGKDNISNDEFKLCLQYYNIWSNIQNCTAENLEEFQTAVENTSLSADVKALLNTKLEKQVSSEQKIESPKDSSILVEAQVTAFVDKASTLTRKALKPQKVKLETEKANLEKAIAEHITDEKKIAILQGKLKKLPF